MDPQDRKNLMGLAVAAALIALSLFVLHLFSRNGAIERCLLERRRDCVPIDQGG